MYKIWPRTARDQIEIWPFETKEEARQFIIQEYKIFNFTDIEIENIIKPIEQTK